LILWLDLIPPIGYMRSPSFAFPFRRQADACSPSRSRRGTPRSVDALAIQLLQLTGDDTYVFARPAPAFVVAPAVDDGEGFVADASARGILFLSPFSLQVFEENNGTTNTSTVRGESIGLFVLQRPDAAATLSAS
jgi:hypothetical protein